MDAVLALISLAGAYFLGSLPFSFWIAKLWGIRDIRQVGSGNPGATNVYRVAGPIPGILALTLDATKGFLAVRLPEWILSTQNLPPWFLLLLGLTAMMGHIFPVWLGFRGGKGVATMLGVMFAWTLPGTLLILVGMMIILAIRRMMSLASLSAAIWFPFVLILETTGSSPDVQVVSFPFWFLALLIPLVVIWTHRENLRRLVAGKERTLTFRNPKTRTTTQL